MGIFIALACLFPPWVYTFQAKGISQVKKPAGYSILFSPPEPEGDSVRFGIALDFTRLGSEIIIILIFGSLGIFSLRQANQRTDRDTESHH